MALQLDPKPGRTAFNLGILAVRSISLKANDFPHRVAEAQTKMWRAAGGGFDLQTNALKNQPSVPSDPLELKIRSRMSVSHVYDCVWSWRKEMAGQQVCEYFIHFSHT